MRTLKDHLLALVHCYEQQLQLMAQELAAQVATVPIQKQQEALKQQEQALGLAIVKMHLGEGQATGPFLYFHVPGPEQDWMIHLETDDAMQSLSVDVQVFPCISVQAQVALPA